MTPLIDSLLIRFRAGIRPNPERDWAVILLSSLIILAGIVVWNIRVFDTVARGGVIGTPPAKSSSVFNRALLSDVRAIFEARASEELKYRTGTYQYADPSQ